MKPQKGAWLVLRQHAYSAVAHNSPSGKFLAATAFQQRASVVVLHKRGDALIVLQNIYGMPRRIPKSDWRLLGDTARSLCLLGQEKQI